MNVKTSMERNEFYGNNVRITAVLGVKVTIQVLFVCKLFAEFSYWYLNFSKAQLLDCKIATEFMFLVHLRMIRAQKWGVVVMI